MTEEKELYKGLEPMLNCIDYTVSKEQYNVMYNKKYDMLVTSPVPEDLEDYYISDNYISHTDSTKNIFDKVYQYVKNISLKRKLGIINSFNTDKKELLDIGAGTGDFLKTCLSNGWAVTGIEPSKKASEIAIKKNIVLHENINLVKNKKFDVITLWHVLEHLPDLFNHIEKFKQLLKPNGKLVIAVPNYKSYDAKFYKEYWAAFDVPRHLWHFSKNSIEKIFNTFNFCIEKSLPMKFDSYYVSLLSEEYKTGNKNPIKAFYRGFVSNLKAKKTKEYSSLIYILKNS